MKKKTDFQQTFLTKRWSVDTILEDISVAETIAWS